MLTLSNYRRFPLEYPSAPLPAILQSLPIELWHVILSHLDPVSAVHLALSCRALYHSLGPAPFRQLSEDPNAKLDFLTTLSPLLPDHWLCARCFKWHASNLPFYKYLWRTVTLPKKCLGRTGDLVLTDVVTINVADAMSAVRYEKFGPRFGRPLTNYAKKKIGSDGWSCSVASKVVRGSLLIKTVTWRDFAADEGWASKELWWDGYVLSHSCCPHEEVFCGSERMKRVLPLRDTAGQALRYRRFQGNLARCNACLSDYLIDMERSAAGTGSWTFRLSRWLDLGACEHANSPLWHAAAHKDCRCPTHRDFNAEYFYSLESPGHRFEGAGEIRAGGDNSLARRLPAEGRSAAIFKMYPV